MRASPGCEAPEQDRLAGELGSERGGALAHRGCSRAKTVWLQRPVHPPHACRAGLPGRPWTFDRLAVIPGRARLTPPGTPGRGAVGWPASQWVG
jgi:hypothetical protein